MENGGQTVSKKKAFVVIIAIGVLSFLAGFLLTDSYNYGDESYDTGSGGDCNVLVFSLYGYLSTYTPAQYSEEEIDVTSSEDIVDGILVAREDDSVKAVLLSVDSGGGDMVAGEEIANALKALDKPSLALIRGLGASAAYWAATGADKIYASRVSDVGSIGVTASYLDESKKNTQEGYTYNELSSAKYKDLWNPSRPITAEERELVLADLAKAHNVFVEDVAKNRNLEQSQVESLANGLSYIGQDALAYGLIDEIGDFVSAVDYIEEQVGEEADFCWY